MYRGQEKFPDTDLRFRNSSLSVLDRVLYALFSRHADRSRHEHDRKRYRGTDVRVSFDVYLARAYGLSWLAFALASLAVFAVAVSLPPSLAAAVASFLTQGLPGVSALPVPHVPRAVAAAIVAVLSGAATKHATIRLAGRYLGWMANVRQSNIRQTLPGAVRYLQVLASGGDDERAMLRKVAARREAYGETAVAFRRVLNKAALTGSLADGLRLAARDTPSRDALSPFLVKFREHAQQGPDALEGYLRMEGRMLDHRQSRARQRAEGFLELLAELFIVLLVMPALFVIVVTVLSVLAPGLGQTVATPVGTVSVRAIIVYGCAGFILLMGATAAALIDELRPANQSPRRYTRSDGPVELASTALLNPANAAVVVAPLAVAVTVSLLLAGTKPVNAALLGYVSVSLPVGGVAVRRTARDDAKDREIKDFVHAVSGHVSLGRPFAEAVELVARDVDLGALEADVNALAFNANLTTRAENLREDALARFVDDVGTPLADQTVGLVTGALDVGSDTEEVFDTLQVEVGRLHHEKKELRSNMLVYVAVGWTTALLVVGIMVAVNVSVLDSFEQLSSVSGATAGMALDPNAVKPERDRWRFYVVTQATMLACGWFAGYASRGRYEALLHSGLLVTVAYVVFAGAGLI